MITPVVSVVVPCYNQARYLDEALMSVLQQTYQNWECIIVDDGSPDETAAIAKSWIEKDSRFKYFHQDNGGLCAARNTGIEVASGRYILPLDADDKISADYLELAVEILDVDGDIKVVYSEAEYFGEKTGKWELGEYSLSNLAIRNVIFCSGIFRKVDWSGINGYDKNMRYGLEDWEFWISLLKNGGKVKKIDRVCFYYRVKQTSMVTELNGNRIFEMYDYLSVKHADFFVRHLGSFKILISQNAVLRNSISSEKFLINKLTSKYFGFEFFKIVDKIL